MLQDLAVSLKCVANDLNEFFRLKSTYIYTKFWNQKWDACVDHKNTWCILFMTRLEWIFPLYFSFIFSILATLGLAIMQFITSLLNAFIFVSCIVWCAPPFRPKGTLYDAFININVFKNNASNCLLFLNWIVTKVDQLECWTRNAVTK